jgi:hypothetical protein
MELPSPWESWEIYENTFKHGEKTVVKVRNKIIASPSSFHKYQNKK